MSSIKQILNNLKFTIVHSDYYDKNTYYYKVIDSNDQEYLVFFEGNELVKILKTEEPHDSEGDEY